MSAHLQGSLPGLEGRKLLATGIRHGPWAAWAALASGGSEAPADGDAGPSPAEFEAHCTGLQKLSSGPACFPRLDAVLSARLEAPQRPVDGEDNETTQLLGEATSAFQARLGKYSREVALALQTPDWWGQLILSNVLRRPLQRLTAWLQSAGAFELERLDSQPMPPVVELVTKRAAECVDAYSVLLGEEAWSDVGTWSPMRAHMPETQKWRGAALLQLLELAADAARRIVLPTTEFPLLLAWLAAAPPAKECAARSHVCSLLLTQGDLPCRRGAVDTLSDLLRRRYREELGMCVFSGGAIDPGLHKLMVCVPVPQPKSRRPVADLPNVCRSGLTNRFSQCRRGMQRCTHLAQKQSTAPR